MRSMCLARVTFLQPRRTSLLIIVIICCHTSPSSGYSVVVLNETSGMFQSPGYPDLDDDMNCTWIIAAPLHHKVTLIFLDFELEDQPICTDEVKILDGNFNLGTFTGTELHGENITSSSNSISVFLVSCSSSLLFDRKGILVSYSTDNEATTQSSSVSSEASSVLTPPVLPTTVHIETSSSPTRQGLLFGVIGAVLATLFLFTTMIVVFFLFLKRKKATSTPNVSSNHSDESQTKNIQAADDISLANMDDGYIEVDEEQSNNDSVYYSRDIDFANSSSL